jgi:hypothetical protein
LHGTADFQQKSPLFPVGLTKHPFIADVTGIGPVVGHEAKVGTFVMVFEENIGLNVAAAPACGRTGYGAIYRQAGRFVAGLISSRQNRVFRA